MTLLIALYWLVSCAIVLFYTLHGEDRQDSIDLGETLVVVFLSWLLAPLMIGGTMQNWLCSKFSWFFDIILWRRK